MHRLVLIRHGESEWNKANLFTGWTDVDLSEKGMQEAAEAGVAMKEAGFCFEYAYTSQQLEDNIAARIWEKYDSEIIAKRRCYRKGLMA